MFSCNDSNDKPLIPSPVDSITAKKLIFDEKLTGDANLSGDENVILYTLNDKIKMWKLIPKKSIDENGDTTLMVSPVSAINAAKRYFDIEGPKLIGLTTDQAIKYLEIPESHKFSSYNFPFHSLGKDEKALVFRFDCGNYGWQIDLLYDDQQKIFKNRIQWIH